MEWERKGRFVSSRRRMAGICLLCFGVVLLAGGVALAVTVGTLYATLLLVGSVVVNTVAVVCLRAGRKSS
ncbi:MAG: hypothetical protein FWE32_11675 [Oscillospiraceae bacterium]|nr:hypothetical protein [Oscillospiraceae bacterium]